MKSRFLAFLAAIFPAVGAYAADSDLNGALPKIEFSRAAAPPQTAGVPKSVDVSNQFPDPPYRNQEDVGSCHIFAGVALLEAALFRHSGKCVRLSEADLFIQSKVSKGQLWEDFVKGKDDMIQEGADPVIDLHIALEQGVASTLAYDDFYERYKPYRDKVEAVVDGV
ncbi:MAG: C1 family peptidase, partial [Elusimicrobia bacterium]|nr:C1 family peptidase [Elusimicrobiota bacterium]